VKLRVSLYHGRLSVGLGIGRHAVRAVALRRGRIIWAAERGRGDESLATTIQQLLTDAPLPRWPRAQVIAAVGPSYAQTKRLIGLPALSDASRLDDVVRESASRFFLRNGVPLVTAVRLQATEPALGAAVEQPVLEAIEQACRGRRVRLVAVVPAVAVVGLAADRQPGETRVTWLDGDLAMAITMQGGAQVAVRRAAARETEAAPPLSSALDCLGPDAWRFADALGAARTQPAQVLSWRRDYVHARRRSISRGHVVAGAAAAIIAGASVLVAPGVAARAAEHEARARLASLAMVRREVAVAERELAKLTVALREVAAFDTARYSVTRLIGDLTGALPDESALVTVRLARHTGSLVALTPRAAAVLVRLEGVRGIGAAEIVGPVTREVVAGKTLERVTIRFGVDLDARRIDGGA
jgi:hypothetical protein